MKTQISFKEGKTLWEQKRNFGKYSGNIHWVLDQDGDALAVVYKNTRGLWQIHGNKLGRMFDQELEFKNVVTCQHYVENKLLKWIKNIISIKI